MLLLFIPLISIHSLLLLIALLCYFLRRVVIVALLLIRLAVNFIDVKLRRLLLFVGKNPGFDLKIQRSKTLLLAPQLRVVLKAVV